MTDFPQPLTVPTPLNIRAGADCLEFLVRVVRTTKMDMTDDDLYRFQETNWDTLVRSIRAWADALETVQRNTVKHLHLKDDSAEDGTFEDDDSWADPDWQKSYRESFKPRDPFCYGEGQCTNPDHEGLVCHTHEQSHTPVSRQATTTDSNTTSKREES